MAVSDEMAVDSVAIRNGPYIVNGIGYGALGGFGDEDKNNLQNNCILAPHLIN